MIAFERRHARKDSVIDSRVSNLQQRIASCFEGTKDRRIEKIKSVHQIRRGRGLRDFSRRERGYVLRGRRKDVDVNVKLRKPERLELLSLVDEMIGDSLR